MANRHSTSRPPSEEHTSIHRQVSEQYSQADAKLLQHSAEGVLDDTTPLASTTQSWNSRPIWTQWRWNTGWRFGVMAASVATGVTLLINLILTVWVAVHFSSDDGIGTAYEGSCDIVTNWSRWLHIFINIISSVVLTASNYCMQCLTSPTRAEVDAAHAKGDWVDIGVVGTRNLTRISRKRATLWWILAFSSIPIHLLYNSAIFKTQDNARYDAYLVPEIFVSSGDLSPNSSYVWGGAAFSRLRTAVTDGDLFNISKFQNNSNADCMGYYDAGFVSGRRSVLAVASISEGNAAYGYWSNQSAVDHDWLETCTDYTIHYGSGSCPIFDQPGGWQVDGHNITYCISELNTQHCALQFSTHILVIVIIFNVLKAGAMIGTLYAHDGDPLVTIGEAIANFLEYPDANTFDMCLMSKADIKWLQDGQATHPKAWVDKRSHWWKASSFRRRSYCLWIHFFIWVGSCVMCSAAFSTLGNWSTPAALWSLGFGSPNPRTIIGTALPQESAGGLVLAAVLANLPQALLSLFNLAYNSLFTCMLLSEEWSRYAVQRRGLRVTNPKGAQRSTYWLQLPFKFSIPMIVTWTFIHWVVSQSIFLVRIKDYTESPDPPAVSTAGFSGLPIIFFIVVDGVLLLILIGAGWRKFSASMPIAGSCSAAISAACHRRHEEVDAALKPVQWGAVTEEGLAYGHCCFSSEEVTIPEVGKQYAGLPTSP